jgi:hypothetical protein
MAAKEAAERDEVTGRLSALLNKTPANYATWSHQRVRAYKDAMDKARSLTNKPKAALRSLREAETTIRQFHEGK